METDINDFIVALITTGAVLHKDGETIKAKGLTLLADKDGIKVCRGESSIYPEHYGFEAIQEVGKEIHFKPKAVALIDKEREIRR
ncbi:MAG: hypothetical protein V1732_00115 [Patescibacteria group bacterium]